MPPLAAEFYAALVRKLKEIGYLVGRCCRRTITTCGNEVDVARQVGGEITPTLRRRQLFPKAQNRQRKSCGLRRSRSAVARPRLDRELEG
jgi:hypothetical protein